MSSLFLKKGLKFNCYGDLHEFIQKYELQERAAYSVYKSKTISAACVKRKIEEQLIYYSIWIVCQCSGEFKSKGKGIRKTSSVKTNCPAFIKVRASKDGKSLEVYDYVDEHNHPPLDESSEIPVDADQENEGMHDRGESISDASVLHEETELETYNGSQVRTDELKRGETCQETCIDIENMSIYIAQDTNAEIHSSIDLDNNDLNTTLPVISIEGLPKNLKILKTNIAGTSNSRLPETIVSTITSIKSQVGVISKGISDPLIHESIAFSHHCKISEDSSVENNVATTLDASAFIMEKENLENIPLTAPSCNIIDKTHTILDIKMPPITRSKGRPKGAATMAIGLPKATRRAIAFKEKTETQKMTMILKLLVPDDFAENAVNGEYEIQLNDVQHLTPATLTDTLMDDLVDLRIVRRCFTTEAFAELSSLVLRKKEIGSFSCGKCNRGIAEQKCVICDGCLLWHHFRCLGLKRVPKKASWFCAKCSGTH